MKDFKPIIGSTFIIMAAIVAIHTVIEPLYHVSTEDNPYSVVWHYINPLIAASIILGLILSYIRICRVDDNTNVQEFLAANTLFYGFIFLAILFFWNWFGILGIGSSFTIVSADIRSLVWILFDAIFPLWSLALGRYVLRSN